MRRTVFLIKLRICELFGLCDFPGLFLLCRFRRGFFGGDGGGGDGGGGDGAAAALGISFRSVSSTLGISFRLVFFAT